jgi:RNA polymerase sigma factor (sigma-70 family)
MNDTDLELLGRYTRLHIEDAFSEVVRRHVAFVYSAALRQVRSPQLAEEVTQSVFIDLARQAAMLTPNTVLTAWLYQVTRRTAIDVIRREANRQAREQIATEMNALKTDPGEWTHIEPLLDEAMHTLEVTDRAAVLLRYFENKSLKEVGTALGSSENAAQKRLSRAIERLKDFFARHGIKVGESALAVIISANAVQSAPAGLAATVSAAAALTGIHVLTTSTAAVGKALTMTAMQKALITAVLVAVPLIATMVEQHRSNRFLREENTVLRARTHELADLEALRAENQRLAKLQTDANELTRLRKDQAELLRLRGEVGLLRRQIVEAAQKEGQRTRETTKTVNPPSQAQGELPAGTLRFVEADAQSMVLPLYAELAGLELEVSPAAAAHVSAAKVTLENNRTMTRAEAVALIEQALREQGGLDVRRSAPGHATVLFDQALMIKTATRR